MQNSEKSLNKKMKIRIAVYLFFCIIIGVICCAGIFKVIKLLPTIDSVSVCITVMFLPIEFILLKNLCSLFGAVKSKSYVDAIVSEIKVEKCNGDECGSYYNAYRVFVDYTYQDKIYKNVFWYALDDDKTPVATVIKNLPVKGQQIQILINPKKPHKILSGKPTLK